MSSRPDLWKTALFSLVMLLLAALCNGTMDRISFRYGESAFARAPAEWQPWLNPAISWHNKWKDGDRAKGEKFFLSSTALVWTTDAWHLLKMLMLSCFKLAILAPFTRLVSLRWWVWVLVFFGMDLIWGLGFEAMFR